MSEITLENVTKRFDDTVAVDDVSLTIRDGEVMGIVGPSGCGKTTTLRLVAGFETASEGVVRFDGDDVTHMPPERRNVGLVFQSYALFNNITVLKNVTFGPKMHGVGKRERIERAEYLLELLDIDDLADRDPQTLSGGQQQRVGLARALAIEPRILLLDEPMTGLDAELKQTLRKEMGELLDDLEVTTLYVTHDQEQVMAMCDRIAVMNGGVIEQVGRPSEVYESPANPFVANFIGTSNLLEGRVEGGVVDFGVARIEADGLPEGDEASVAVRPDDFRIGDGPTEATITNLFYLGGEVQAIAQLDDGTEITLELGRYGETYEEGDTVPLSVDTENVHVIEQ